jgi:hypothetical protein
VFTPAQIAGNFSGISKTIVDPTTGNIILPSGLDPVSVSIANTYSPAE